MTDKPTPTDAELEALLLYKLPASKHYIRPVIEKMVAAMQAAIDKWGQTAQAAEPVAREPLPKFLALKFHARRDKKATVTLLFPGHEAADAWVRGIKGSQSGTE